MSLGSFDFSFYEYGYNHEKFPVYRCIPKKYVLAALSCYKNLRTFVDVLDDGMIEVARSKLCLCQRE
jgi:hypothetical protein